jgi:hypothetical protein
MIPLEPIDPFLSELKLAQVAGQRVLAAAARRSPSGAGKRGRGEQTQHSGELPIPGARLSGAAGQRAE